MNGALKDLIDNIGDLKADQPVIQDLLNRVGVLEQTPDEVSRQLSEYVRNFDVINERQLETGRAVTKVNKELVESFNRVIKAINGKQIYINRSVVTQIQRAVERSTGMTIREYVTKTQERLIQQQYQEVKQAQAETLKRTQRISDRLDGFGERLDALEGRIEMAYDRMSWLVMLVGAGALLVTVPLYVMAFDRHPILTGILLGLLLVLIVWLLISQRGGKDDE